MFDLIDKFAGYGFNKSHAAAYALLAYQTAWLKAHHPPEFFAASMASTSAADRQAGDLRRRHAAAGRARACRRASTPARRSSRSRASAVRYALGRAQGRRREGDGGDRRRARGGGRFRPLSRLRRAASTRGCSTSASSRRWRRRRVRRDRAQPRRRPCAGRGDARHGAERRGGARERAGGAVRRGRGPLAGHARAAGQGVDAGRNDGAREGGVRLLFLRPPGRKLRPCPARRTRSAPLPRPPASSRRRGEGGCR